MQIFSAISDSTRPFLFEIQVHVSSFHTSSHRSEWRDSVRKEETAARISTSTSHDLAHYAMKRWPLLPRCVPFGPPPAPFCRWVPWAPGDTPPGPPASMGLPVEASNFWCCWSIREGRPSEARDRSKSEPSEVLERAEFSLNAEKAELLLGIEKKR